MPDLLEGPKNQNNPISPLDDYYEDDNVERCGEVLSELIKDYFPEEAKDILLANTMWDESELRGTHIFINDITAFAQKQKESGNYGDDKVYSEKYLDTVLNNPESIYYRDNVGNISIVISVRLSDYIDRDEGNEYFKKTRGLLGDHQYLKDLNYAIEESRDRDRREVYNNKREFSI